VEHVQGMDTILTSNALRLRAISVSVLTYMAAWVMAIGSALVDAAHTVGAFTLARLVGANGGARHRTFPSTALGFLVWLIAFVAFSSGMMWQSPQWSYQQAALRFYVGLLCVGIFIVVRDQRLTRRS
jgi:predicted small integral membrane protein